MNIDLRVEKGDDFTNDPFVFETLTDSTMPYDENLNPYIPVDLTGYTAFMMVRPNVDSDTVLLTLSTNNGITINTNEITIFIGAALTEPLDFETSTVEYVYDLKLFKGPYTYKPLNGKFILCKDITH